MVTSWLAEVLHVCVCVCVRVLPTSSAGGAERREAAVPRSEEGTSGPPGWPSVRTRVQEVAGGDAGSLVWLLAAWLAAWPA